MVDKKGIYLDSAATSFPKPEAVLEAMNRYLRACGNPGRGAHSFSLDAARQIFNAREQIAEYLGIEDSQRLIFTPGCTAALNMVLKGLAGSGELERDDLVITSTLEHNAVMRPLTQLEKSLGLRVESVAPLELLGVVREKRPRLCVVTGASNVTGQMVYSRELEDICSELGVTLVVDAAQTAGKLKIDLSGSAISAWCASGHKGLQGPPGVGLLYIKEGIEIEPLISGGTGSRSESIEIPTTMPDRLEAGTPAGHCIVGLAEGIRWLRDQGEEKLLSHELDLTGRLLAWLAVEDGISLFGPAEDNCDDDQPARMPVVSFKLDHVSVSEVADRLDRQYGIAVRPGLHCAAVAHEYLGTIESGLIRVSFGPSNTPEEVDTLCRALADIKSIAPGPSVTGRL